MRTRRCQILPKKLTAVALLGLVAVLAVSSQSGEAKTAGTPLVWNQRGDYVPTRADCPSVYCPVTAWLKNGTAFIMQCWADATLSSTGNYASRRWYRGYYTLTRWGWHYFTWVHSSYVYYQWTVPHCN